jgi:hypothetical protein
VNGENLAKSILLKIRWLVEPQLRGREKRGGEKIGLSFIKLLKTNIEEMPVFRLSTMLMKTKELSHFFRGVAENKGSYWKSEFPAASSWKRQNSRAERQAGRDPSLLLRMTANGLRIIARRSENDSQVAPRGAVPRIAAGATYGPSEAGIPQPCKA